MIVAVLIATLYGCSGLDIKQEIRTDHDYNNCVKQYTIETAIHLRDWSGLSKECIYLEYRNRVSANDIDSIAQFEYKKAETVKKRAEECFGDDL